MKDNGGKSKYSPTARFLIGFIFSFPIGFISAFLQSSMKIGGPSMPFICVVALVTGIIGGIATVRGGWLLKVVNSIFSGGP
jgi:hypothetical protein